MTGTAIAPALDLFDLERFQRAACGPMAINARLETESLCRQAVAEIGRALASASPQEALAAAKTLVSMYPKAKVQDAEAYLRGAVVALSRCPPDLLPRAVDMLTDAHRWYPSKADIASVVADLVRPRRDALRGAKRLVQEHERRRRERERAQDISRSKAGAAARHGGDLKAYCEAVIRKYGKNPSDG